MLAGIKRIKESAISEKPQSVFDWLRCWNPHENFHPGSTHPNLGFSWEVDDQKRDEEDEAGANIWRRRRQRKLNEQLLSGINWDEVLPKGWKKL